MPHSTQARYPISDLKSNGTDTTYAVTARRGAFLFFGNTSMSGTVLPSQIYMRLMAHVPLLLQVNPVSALVICFGVGNTASAIATHNSIHHLDVVDLNRSVFETAPAFEATNFGVYEDPRVRLINDDGRSYLRRSRDTYDLITSEPPPPMQAGVYRLYSGIDGELILLGSREPIEIDRLWQRFPETGPARADLAAILVDTPATIGNRIVSTDATLRRDYLRGEAISDQRNDLEQMFLTTKSATVSYDPQEVLAWLRVEAPMMAAAIAPILSRSNVGK
jgi:hypothetical protein